MKRTPRKTLSVLAARALCSSVATAQTKLTWAHVYEVSESCHKQVLWAAEEVKKRSAGRAAPSRRCRSCRARSSCATSRTGRRFATARRSRSWRPATRARWAAATSSATPTSASAKPVAFAEVYLALQNGRVDAQENRLPTIDAKKFYEVQKYIMLTGHITESLVTIVAGGVWAKLPEADKTIKSAGALALTLLRPLLPQGG